MPSDDFLGLWASALARYEEKTGSDIVDGAEIDGSAALLACVSVDEVVQALTAELESFTKFRKADPKWTKLQRKMEGPIRVVLSLVDAAGELASSFHAPGGKAIFVAFAVLLRATSGVSERYDALEELFIKLNSFLDRLNSHLENHFATHATFRKIVVDILVQLLDILALSKKLLSKTKFVHYVQSVFGNKEMKIALNKLDMLTTLESQMVNTRTHTKVAQILDAVIEIKERKQVADAVVEALTNQIKELNNHHVNEKLEKWLSPPDPSTNHNRVKKSHLPGTGNWIFELANYTQWLNTPNGLLWIHGKPGSGKTVLLSTVIEELKKASPVAYFYCDFRDASKQTARSVISSLCIQLANLIPACASLLRDFHRLNAGSGQPSDDTILSCLKDLLLACSSSPTFLVIDALDECPAVGQPNREDLLDALRRITCFQNPSLRLLIASRPEPDIRRSMADIITNDFDLHSAVLQAHDLHVYIDFVLSTSPPFELWPRELVQQTSEALSQKADGMFRWVSCQIATLRSAIPKHVPKILSSLPKTLDETYSRMLESVPENDVMDCRRILQCIAFAQYPWTVEQLGEIFATDEDDYQGQVVLKPHFRVRDPEYELLRICSGLIDLVPHPWSAHNPKVVQFSHFSVQEYLLSTPSRLPPNLRDYHINAKLAHSTLAQMCIVTLLASSKSLQEVEDISPLHEYATIYWLGHVSRAGDSSVLDACLYNLLEDANLAIKKIQAPFIWHPTCDRFLDCKSEIFPSWANLPRYNQGVSVSLSPLMLASLGGLHKHVKFLSTHRGLDSLRLALQAAASVGQTHVVRVLLDHELDLNEESGSTMLQRAASNGHFDIVKLLLERGTIFSDDRDALSKAAESGNVEICRLFLDHGFSFRANDSLGMTALQQASSYGHINVIKLLLERGARPEEDSDALCRAVESGKSEALRLLLDHGADANTRDRLGRAALELAAWEGNPSIMKLLLVNRARPTDGPSALFTAIECRNCEILRLLLVHGADANARDQSGRSALELASCDVEPHIVKTLLEYGARPVDSPNALHVAVVNGNSEICRLLLDHGADFSARDRNGSTALEVAAWEGNSTALKLFLERGQLSDREKNQIICLLLAAPIASIREYPTLRLAPPRGCFATVKLLLEHKARFAATLGTFSGALYRAVESENIENICFLLDHGASPWMVLDEYGKRALHDACSANNFGLVKLLIELGARPDDPYAFIAAASSGGIEIVRSFLEQGIKPETCDSFGGTALQAASFCGHDGVIELLIEYGLRPSEDPGALSRAVEGNCTDTVRLLVRHGSRIRASANWHGKTVLQYASLNGNVAIVRILLQSGVLPVEDREALFPSIERRSDEIVQLLLDNGADPKARGQHGRTALGWASLKGNLGAVMLLLEHGVSPEEEIDVIFCAVEGGSADIVRLLLEKGVCFLVIDEMGLTPMNLACSGGHLSIARLFLECGAHLDEDPRAILNAAAAGSVEIVQLLLNNGVDINTHDENGQTALHYALKPAIFAWEVVTELLNREINVNAIGKGRTALDLALHREARLVELLRRRGALDSQEAALRRTVRMRSFLE